MRTLLEAIIYDQMFGDPPNEYHPTAWMGNAIGRLKAEAPAGDDQARMGFGAVIVLGGAAVVFILGQFLQRITRGLPFGLGYSIDGWLLKTTFSFSGLVNAADEVRSALESGDLSDLSEARRLVSLHLVSRDTSELDASQIAAATIESVAENLSDGVVAPLLYYAIGGLPLALAYRWVNTCGSMLGYRDEEHEWLGKIPAKFGDIVNFAPARLTAQALLLAGERTFERDADLTLSADSIYQRDADMTDSLNAGHPMSAAAGVLGVELEKAGQYNLGAGQRQPQSADIGRMIELAQNAMLLVSGVLFVYKTVTWAFGAVKRFRRRFCE
ncbi:MAG: adenosylcobinamide-phosphate synthase [Candidatus Promineifilaceae bacterium]|jgi:adenosylcobinamide-phosphate synthase